MTLTEIRERVDDLRCSDDVHEPAGIVAWCTQLIADLDALIASGLIITHAHPGPDADGAEA